MYKRLLIISFALFFCITSYSQLYRCTNSSGKIVFSDRVCDKDLESSTVKITPNEGFEGSSNRDKSGSYGSGPSVSSAGGSGFNRQKRNDRCEKLIKTLGTIDRKKAYAIVCGANLSESEFDRCINLLNEPNSRNGLDSIVRMCTGQALFETVHVRPWIVTFHACDCRKPCFIQSAQAVNIWLAPTFFWLKVRVQPSGVGRTSIWQRPRHIDWNRFITIAVKHRIAPILWIEKRGRSMFKTKKQRLWFTVSAFWFVGWTIAYIGSAFSSVGFKPDGWFMFAVLPILIVWGVATVIIKLRGWINRGSDNVWYGVRAELRKNNCAAWLTLR